MKKKKYEKNIPNSHLNPPVICSSSAFSPRFPFMSWCVIGDCKDNEMVVCDGANGMHWWTYRDIGQIVAGVDVTMNK